ncbi:hypothetical protein [Lacunimicrobium album]
MQSAVSRGHLHDDIPPRVPIMTVLLCTGVPGWQIKAPFSPAGQAGCCQASKKTGKVDKLTNFHFLLTVD